MRGIVTAHRRALVLCGVLVLWTPVGAAESAGQAEAPAQKEPSARKREAPPVKVKVKTGGDVEPEAGAPPPPSVSMERKTMRGTVGPGPARPADADAIAGTLVAVAFGEGEATLEVAGTRQVVRPGSQLGDDTVRSVAPGRIVLERPASPEEGGGAALVIVTFDASGRSRTQVFGTTDPTRPAAPEVKRP